jgi:Pyruvate/2-oxoacid:ferredoxin oxidoreductase delta subunit
MPPEPHILYCHCAFTDLVPRQAREAVLRGLAAAGLAFEAVADLCDLAARHDPALARLAARGGLRIIACRPRAVRWMMEWAGAPLPRAGSEVLDLRADGPEAVLRAVGAARGAKQGEPPAPSNPKSDNLPAGPTTARPVAVTGRQVRNPKWLAGNDAAPSVEALLADLEAAGGREGAWVPWFPVIDYGRCKACKQCLNFCLFGTYSLDEEGRVRVASPAKCKTNCPACARVCPELAIIFPKHAGGPINGAEVTEADLERRDVRIGIEAHSREDIYAALRGRGRQGPGGGRDPR